MGAEESMRAACNGELVRRAQAGDGSATEELLGALRRPVYLLSLQLLGRREDALDVMQEALLRLLQNLALVDTERPLEPCLFRVVRNRAIDLLGRRHGHREEPFERLVIGNNGSVRAREPASESRDPETLLREKEQKRRVGADGAYPLGRLTTRRTITTHQRLRMIQPALRAHRLGRPRMVEQARSLGANAIVGVSFTTSMVMTTAAELLAYGTAVVLEDE
jgi:hypothetical protein